MAKKLSRAARRRKVHLRIRSRVQGNSERPRVCVFRSARHMYAQLIDDVAGKTLTTVSTLNLGGKKKNGGNIAAAKEVGKTLAEAAKEMGFEEVVFDRNGFVYHGRVKAVAEAAREAGLKF